jgi:hypothetical protein
LSKYPLLQVWRRGLHRQDIRQRIGSPLELAGQAPAYPANPKMLHILSIFFGWQRLHCEDSGQFFQVVRAHAVGRADVEG